MSNPPIVSVLMSAYNGERFLRSAMNSILTQTLQDFELIVVDDGSTDRTAEILDQYNDARMVRVTNTENLGLTRFLNRGLNVARGEFVARQDVDDVSLPERLTRQAEFLRDHREILLVSSEVDYIDVDGNTLGRSTRARHPGLVAWYLLFYNHLGGHSQVMFRRKEILALGGYCEARPYSQDHELWLRVSACGKIAIMPEVLLQWRCHKQSISSTPGSVQEAYSLEDSRRALERLLANSITPRQVEELRGFWLDRYPAEDRLTETNLLLRRLYRSFVHHSHCAADVDRLPDWQLRRVIGKQFLRWMANLSTRRQPTARLKASIVASTWYPPAALVGLWRTGRAALLRLLGTDPVYVESSYLHLKREDAAVQREAL